MLTVQTLPFFNTKGSRQEAKQKETRKFLPQNDKGSKSWLVGWRCFANTSGYGAGIKLFGAMLTLQG